MISDTYLLQKSAGRAGEILGITDWYDDLNLVQIFRGIYIMCGGDELLMRHWIHTPNTYLKSRVAANLITTEQGIQDVLDQVLYFSH